MNFLFVVVYFSIIPKMHGFYMDKIPMGAFYMEACRLSQGFGSHAMGEKKKNIIS
jgi:hypothetical protein